MPTVIRPTGMKSLPITLITVLLGCSTLLPAKASAEDRSGNATWHARSGMNWLRCRTTACLTTLHSGSMVLVSHCSGKSLNQL